VLIYCNEVSKYKRPMVETVSLDQEFLVILNDFFYLYLKQSD